MRTIASATPVTVPASMTSGTVERKRLNSSGAALPRQNGS